MKKNSLLLFLLSVFSIFTLFGCDSCSEQGEGGNGDIGSIGEIQQTPFLSLSKTELNEFVIGDSQIIFADFAEIEGTNLKWEISNDTASENDKVVEMEILNKYSCKLTAVRVGEATLTATCGTLKQTCTIKVSLNNLYPSLEFESNRTEVINIFPNSKLDLSAYVAFNGKKFDDADINYTVADPTFGSVDKEQQTFTSLNKLGLTTITVQANWRGVASELLERTITVKVVAPKTVILKDAEGKSIQQMYLYTVDSFEGTTYKKEQTISEIVVQEANDSIENYTVAITDSVAGDGSDTPVATWDSVNKKIIVNTYGSANLTISFDSPATGEPFSYSFAITAVRPLAEYKTPIQNFSWLIGDLPVDTIFAGGSTNILNAEQDGRALTIVENKLIDVVATSDTQMSEERITVYNDKVGYILTLETYAMAIDSAEEFQAYLDSDETRTITGYFELKKDINIQNAWNFTSDKMTFGGVLEGNGYTLTVPMRAYGVFGSITGTLQNLHLHVTGVSSKGAGHATSVISKWAGGKANVKDMYVSIDLAQNATFPYSFSLFGSSDNSFQMRNFVADLGDKLPADGYNAGQPIYYNMHGILFQYISYIDESNKRETNYDNVYIISSGLKELVNRHDGPVGTAKNCNIYAGNDTELYENYTLPTGTITVNNVPTESTETKYQLNTIKRYDTYADFVGSENSYESFTSKYWEIINGGLYWKGVYEQGVRVLTTDETDEEIDEYKLQTTTDKVKVSMVDMYGNVLDGVDCTIENDDGILTVENGEILLVKTVEEDKEYTVKIKAVVEGITIERNITIKALAIRTTYTQEVYLATNSDYAGTDQYVLTTAGLDAMPTDIVSASLNGVALTITDGKLPDITMDYIKKFESYGKTRETYMNIYAGETSIVSEKADQTPLTLTIKTATETIEFTNLFVCTDVIQTAADLNRFSITYRSDADERSVYANDGYYVMTNNIDAKDLAFKHNNNAYDPYRRFVGTFDGRGYTISNLNVDRENVVVTGNTEVYGLFGNLYGADILNVGFVNVSAEGGSVLGTHSSYVVGSYTAETGALTTSAHIYPAIHSTTYNYMSTRIENVYIQVADSVQSMQGALCSTMGDYNFLINIVIEWNPTNGAELSAGFGSFIGSGTLDDANKPKRENVVVLSSVALNKEMTSCSGVAVFTDRATMESENTSSLESFGAYWATTSNSPVWNTANWQK